MVSGVLGKTVLPVNTPESWQLRARVPLANVIVPTLAVLLPAGQPAGGVPVDAGGGGGGGGGGAAGAPGTTTTVAPGEAISSAPHAVTAMAAALASNIERIRTFIISKISAKAVVQKLCEGDLKWKMPQFFALR